MEILNLFSTSSNLETPMSPQKRYSTASGPDHIDSSLVDGIAWYPYEDWEGMLVKDPKGVVRSVTSFQLPPKKNIKFDIEPVCSEVLERVVKGDYCECIQDYGGGKDNPVLRRGFYKKAASHKVSVFDKWQTVVKRDQEARKVAEGMGVTMGKDLDISGDTGDENVMCEPVYGTEPAGKCDKPAKCDGAVVPRPGAMTLEELHADADGHGAKKKQEKKETDDAKEAAVGEVFVGFFWRGRK